MAQVFVYPPSLQMKTVSAEHQVTRQRAMYVIRNSRLDPEWAQVERRTMSIAARDFFVNSDPGYWRSVHYFLDHAAAAKVKSTKGYILIPRLDLHDEVFMASQTGSLD